MTNKLIRFDEYKRMVEEEKQRVASRKVNIACPCCECGLFFKNEPIDEFLTCRECEWEGELPI